MRIVMRDNYKRQKDVLIAEVYDKCIAINLCRILNANARLNGSHYFYQIVSDKHKVGE